MTGMDEGVARPGGALRVRNPQDAGAGVFLLAVAAFALWQGADLPLGTLRSMGAGMLPTSLAVLVGAFGLALIGFSLVQDGPGLDRWRLRGPVFILGSVVVFAVLIRTAGLAVAGPVSMLVSCFATDEVRWKEAIIFSLGMTAFCILLFKVMLSLPIPVFTLF